MPQLNSFIIPGQSISPASCPPLVVRVVQQNISNQHRKLPNQLAKLLLISIACSPQRGSFPLDHYAECKDAMTAYLSCMKSARSVNDVCRDQAKSYLKCRMDRNLMAPDSMKNLGFHEKNDEPSAEAASKAQKNS